MWYGDRLQVDRRLSSGGVLAGGRKWKMEEDNNNNNKQQKQKQLQERSNGVGGEREQDAA